MPRSAVALPTAALALLAALGPAHAQERVQPTDDQLDWLRRLPAEHEGETAKQ